MTARYIAETAYNALVAEVSVTPKPGLVDKNNNGAHSDMNIDHFLLSAKALMPYFERIAAEAQHSNDDLLTKLRQIGIDAENKMLKVTGGVNTHKGAIFSMSALCAATALLDSCDTDSICRKAAEIALFLPNYQMYGKITNGQRAFMQFGVKGVRGEVQSGFESVRFYALPVYEKTVNTDGHDIASVKTLLSLMANVRDTNVIKRGGLKGEKIVQDRASYILENFSISEVEMFDNELISLNISPGGCADLLAVTFFLYNLKKGE